MIRLIVVALLLLSSAFAQTSTARDPELAKFFAAEWDYQMQQNPVWASLLGDRRFNDRWDDLSAEGLRRDREHTQAALEQLKRFDRARLSPDDQLSYDLFLHLYNGFATLDRLNLDVLAMTHMGGLPETFRMTTDVQVASQLADNLRFATVKDYQDWNARLRTFPAYVEQVIALLREGMRLGMMQPKVIMQRVPPQVEAQISQAPRQSPFYKPLREFPEAIPAAERERLAAGAEANIAGVNDSLRALHQFLVREYIPAAPEKIGIGQWKNGAEVYAALTREHTTTDLAPDHIHEMGLREVARIRAEMEKLKSEVGFQGTLADFFQHLRTDPKFYYREPEALLSSYRNIAKVIDPRVIKVIGTPPRMPYGVEPTPAASAPAATTGFYFPAAPDGSRAGTYQVNLYKPETRPRWEMVPLTLHEAVPGHHLQVSRAAELEGLPAFRNFAYYTAYGEGWGLYCETTLGYDMDLYGDPYDRFGQLAYEQWRAIRLVVDTGMHLKGWTRQSAIDYFLENSPRQELDVVNEIDRYIATPGQALGYKIGELKLRELRANAQKQLGERFDLREFHDVVLGAGSLPLDVLEKRVGEWVKAKESGVASQ